MILDQLNVPVVLAPLAGGPSTPELTAAVSGAGGLGFLGSGYLRARDLVARIAAVRRLTSAPFGVNVFSPGPGPTEPTAYAAYLDRLRGWAQHADAELGDPRYSDDDWGAKLALLTADPVAVVSFTFGCPDPATVDSLRSAGSEVWVTVTTPREASYAEAAGASALVVQGAEAGGHRGSFEDDPELPVYGLLALLALVRATVSLPLVATGGIADGHGVAAVLCAGASAAQLGTAFMLAPEAGTSDAHRAALRGAEQTVLTRAFTGRLARGIRNRFIAEHDRDAPVAYPELHHVTAPMRRRAREQGDPDRINLWAGEAHQLALEVPAAEIVRRISAGARDAVEAARQRLNSQPRPIAPK
jgi:nitronate monooxygenase